MKKNINKLIKENNEAYVEKCRDCGKEKEFCPCVDLSFLKPKPTWKPRFTIQNKSMVEESPGLSIFKCNLSDEE